MPQHENEREAIRNLQRYLRQLAYFDETLGEVPIDGIFETQTEAALREYQRLRGLPVTGRADRATWERLYADYRTSLSRNTPPRMIRVFPPDPPGYKLDTGSQGFAVNTVQYMLRELHHSHKELENVMMTGIYDKQTSDAVRVFQERNLLPVDGLVDLLTWNALSDAYNALFLRVGEE